MNIEVYNTGRYTQPGRDQPAVTRFGEKNADRYDCASDESGLGRDQQVACGLGQQVALHHCHYTGGG